MPLDLCGEFMGVVNNAHMLCNREKGHDGEHTFTFPPIALARRGQASDAPRGAPPTAPASPSADELAEALAAVSWAPSDCALDDGPCWCTERPWKAELRWPGGSIGHDDECLRARALLARRRA